jgi:predicted RNase H-like HicB family nuclease
MGTGTNSSFVGKTRRQALAGWKYAISFRKRHWQLSDFPVWIHEQKSEPSNLGSGLRRERFIASIINWPVMTAAGDTRREAFARLRDSLEQVREKRPLPRPGTGLPIEFASQERITIHEALSQDFIRRVLDLEWAWISDESSLWDFHSDSNNDMLNARILEVYGVDVAGIESGNIAEILDRVAAEHQSLR